MLNDEFVYILENEINSIKNNVLLALNKRRNNMKKRPKKLRNKLPFDKSNEEIHLEEAKLQLANLSQFHFLLEKEREQNILINEENFFLPVNQVIKDSKTAVQFLRAAPEKTIHLFWQLASTFPRWKDLILNLAKSQIENGEVEDGVYHLCLFLKNANKSDYKRERVINFLGLNNELTEGELEGKTFVFNGEDIFFSTPIEEPLRIKVPIPYSIPIDLQIQDKGGNPEQLTIDEYSFLVKIEDVFSIEEDIYEVRVPRKHLVNLVDFFLPTLQEEGLSYTNLIDFERLYFENYLIEFKQGLYMNTYSEPFIDALEELIPLMRIHVTKEKSDLFIIEFSQFVERFILPQKNIWDKVQERKQELEDYILDSKQIAEEDGIMYLGIEFQEEIKPQASYYAHLNSLLFNYKNNIGNPLSTQQPIINAESFNQYIDLYGDKYLHFKIPQENIDKMKQQVKNKEITTRITEERMCLLSKIENVKLRNKIDKHWDDISKNLTSDTGSALITMRKSLELLTEAHIKKLGHKDPSSMALAERIDFCKHLKMPNSIWKHMVDIKNFANKEAHDSLHPYSFEKYKRPQPKELKEAFEAILRHYILEVQI